MKTVAIIAFLCQIAVPYHRVPFPFGKAWKTCQCKPVSFTGMNIPKKGELKIDYHRLYPELPADLTGLPIVCMITSDPPRTTITVKSESWTGITFLFSGPNSNKPATWRCDFAVPK